MSIITTFADYTGLKIQDQFDLLKKIDQKYISVRNQQDDFEMLKESLKTHQIKIATYDAGITSYDLYNEEIHHEKLETFETEVKKAKELKALAILIEVPYVKDILNESEFLYNRVKDYLDISKKFKLELVIKPTQGIKTNAYVYLLNQFKKNEVGIIFDTIHLYKNDESLVTSYRILKPYIKVIRVSDIRKDVPVLIGYGELKLLEIFKSFLRDKFLGIIELDTNLFELINHVEQAGFISKFFKRHKINRNAKEALENKIGSLELKDILENQLKVLHSIFK